MNSKSNAPEMGKSLKWLGISLLILGVISVAAPVMAGTSVVIVVGIILLVAGIGQFVSGIRAESWGDKIMPVLLGVITALAGIGVIGHPLLGLGYLTILLLCFFIIEGIWKIIASFRYRPAPGWIWLALSGVLSLLLAYMIWKQWPMSGLWAVGVLVGVNLISTGISLITLSSSVKELGNQLQNNA